MNIELINKNGTNIAVLTGEEKLITDAQSALDLAMTVNYEKNTNLIVIPRKLISDDFFVLSTGLAGEILQKYVNYQIKMAVYGDFSKYTSKPLKDFIYESNQGKDIFFEDTKEKAVDRLAANR